MAREKEFKSLDEQVDIQINDRKLKCSNRDNLKRDLLTKNYFNFINGFEDIFLSKSNLRKIYKRASYSDFKRLYKLDRMVSVYLFEEITKIETQIKTAISYYFSQKYCSSGLNSNLNYLDKNNYYGANSSGASIDDIKMFNRHMLFSSKKGTHATIKNIKFTGNISCSTNINYASDYVLTGVFYGVFKGLSRNQYTGSISISSSRILSFSLGNYTNATLPTI
ncbi:Abi family protein [Helcococcus bovis]|uniref:Abi family protein n=1 Tax=Helcococcus bovis TaxID=3153252 RepID=UPI0038B9AD35